MYSSTVMNNTASSLAANKHLIELLPGEELSEQKVSATNPVIRYVVALPKAAQITFDIKESNTASRTALYLSQNEEFPSAKNASWSCETSRPRKTVVLLPIDERFRVGPCYLSVNYTGTSGVAFFSLRVTMKEHYVARWSFSASMSIYNGNWKLDKRHGKGRVVYYDDPKVFEQAVASGGALGSTNAAGDGLRSPSDLSSNAGADSSSGNNAATGAATESVDTQVRLLAQSFLGNNNNNSTNNVNSSSSVSSSTANNNNNLIMMSRQQRDRFFDVPENGCEYYDGEWVEGEKDGEGTYTWPDMKYEGHWRAGQRSGKGVLIVGSDQENNNDSQQQQQQQQLSKFTGEWRNDVKHGFGVQMYEDGSKYEGMWENNERHGLNGVFTYADGVRLTAEWKRGELLMPVKADFPGGEHYEGEWKNNCRHGKGTLREIDGLIYEGQFVNGVKEGRGIWRLPRGVDFRGTWEGGVRQDRGGEFLFPSTDIYQGEWDTENHVRSGHGTCVYANGITYVGNWENDKRCGHGKLRCPNDETYEGEFLDDLRHGQGHCIYADDNEGGEYEGQWRADLRHGYGEHRYPDGESVYTGEWDSDHYHGMGRMINHKDKWEYSGQWQRDARHGVGSVSMVVETRDDGTDVSESYRGYWRENSRCGEGTIYYANGNAFTGEWKENLRADGRGTCKYSDGSNYEGNFKHELRHGKGVCTFPDGSRYDGEWSHDVMHGEGTLYQLNGEMFVGRWERGNRVDGPGKCVYANSNVYEGEWVDGKPHGQGSLLYADGTAFEGQFVRGEYKL